MTELHQPAPHSPTTSREFYGADVCVFKSLCLRNNSTLQKILYNLTRSTWPTSIWQHRHSSSGFRCNSHSQDSATDLRHAGALATSRAHLQQHFVKPL